MKVKSIGQVVPSKANGAMKNSISTQKPSLILADDEFVKVSAKDEKVPMGALIGVCALGISILYGTFKVTDTLFKRF